MSEKIYPQGIRTFKAGDKAPAFILGTIVIDVNALNEWLSGEGSQYLTDYQGKAQLKLTVLQSDKTGVNLQVDTWKPNK